MDDFGTITAVDSANGRIGTDREEGFTALSWNTRSGDWNLTLPDTESAAAYIKKHKLKKRPGSQSNTYLYDGNLTIIPLTGVVTHIIAKAPNGGSIEYMDDFVSGKSKTLVRSLVLVPELSDQPFVLAGSGLGKTLNMTVTQRSKYYGRTITDRNGVPANGIFIRLDDALAKWAAASGKAASNLPYYGFEMVVGPDPDHAFTLGSGTESSTIVPMQIYGGRQRTAEEIEKTHNEWFEVASDWFAAQLAITANDNAPAVVEDDPDEVMPEDEADPFA